MNRALVLAAVLVATSAPAAAMAEPIAAKFVASSAPDVAGRIAAACAERGFVVRRMSDVDVICQAGDFDRRTFRATRVDADPEKGAYAYHRFVAQAVDGGVLVRERSTVTLNVFGNLSTVEPRGALAHQLGEAIGVFFADLGGLPDGN